jgi:Co/Zn/Cd efflux system component
MKEKAFPHIVLGLLVAYLIYSAFIQVNTSHSIILFSLAGLCGYSQWLLSKSTPNVHEEIAKLKSELEQKLEKQKELHDRKLSEIEGEMTKVSLSIVRAAPSPSSSEKNKKPYVF